jgi:hypothetical protein
MPEPKDSQITSQEQSPDDRYMFLENLDSLVSTDEQIREKQISILLNLPDNLVEQMRAHLMYVDTQQLEYAKKHDRQARLAITREDQLRIIRGELLERLVYTEISIDSENTELELSTRKLGDQALALFHDPERFNIQGTDRNPDFAVIDINKNEIVAVMDAKMGFLDERCYEQANGFRRHMTDILDKVRNFRKKYKSEEEFNYYHGLTDDMTKLRVADKLERIFVVPADRDTTNPEKLVKEHSHEGIPAFRNPENSTHFKQQLASGEIKVQKSLFTTSQIAKLAELIIDQIE